MVEKNRFFAEVENVDIQLLLALKNSTAFSLRSRSEKRIVLASIEGQIICLVNSATGCGPNFIQFKSLPPLTADLPEDGWILENSCLKIPFLTQVKLDSAQQFDSAAKFPVRDFPGHMHGAINNRIRQSDFSGYIELQKKVKILAATIRQYLTETPEIPLLDILGFGSGDMPAGDAAICGMLLTGRSFSLGRRLKVNWHQRLNVEVRRFQHRGGAMGQNWIGHALEGRMTELQQRFFNAMGRDYESADEIVVRKISDDETINGRGFLTGVAAALDLIKADLHGKEQKKSPGLPANRARR